MMKNGFTIIEVLVVVAIITVFGSIIFATVRDTRPRTRDVRRTSDIRQMITALMLYELDNGHFPCGWQSSADPGFLSALSDGGYISQAPKDPVNDGGLLKYQYLTYRDTPGGPCGKYVSFVYNYELFQDGTCPFGTMGYRHCHSFFPEPPPCTDPADRYMWAGEPPPACLLVMD